MNSQPLLDSLEWDTGFFGFGVARLRGTRLSEKSAAACAGRCRQLGIRCVYFLAESDDPESWRAALTSGFSPIDVRVELDRGDLALPQPRDGASLSEPAELSAVLKLSERAFDGSRFSRDRHFPQEKVAELFRLWARRGFEQADWFTIVARREGAFAGFLTGSVRGEVGKIELVAVSPEARGRGIGAELVDGALREFHRRAAARASVVTQASNIASQRLYQAAGFRTRSVGIWFHGWF